MAHLHHVISISYALMPYFTLQTSLIGRGGENCSLHSRPGERATCFAFIEPKPKSMAFHGRSDRTRKQRKEKKNARKTWLAAEDEASTERRGLQRTPRGRGKAALQREWGKLF